MTHPPQRLIASLAVLMAATLPTLAAKKPAEEPAAAAAAAPTAAFKQRGAIVDCTDYILLGNRDAERREVQATSIDSGNPACFISDDGGEVYLLLDPNGQARTRFQPTPNFIIGAIIVEGVVHQRGSLKAVTIERIHRTAPYTDRESRLQNNPQPNRKEQIQSKPKPQDPGTPGAPAGGPGN